MNRLRGIFSSPELVMLSLISICLGTIFITMYINEREKDRVAECVMHYVEQKSREFIKFDVKDYCQAKERMR